MTCDHSEDLILDDLDGRLAPEERPALSSHLASCKSCRAFQAAQLELDGVLAGLREPRFSPRFTQRVLHAVQMPRRKRLLEDAGNLIGVLAVAAAGALAVSLVVPHALAGLSWTVAVLLVSGGVWVTGSLDLL